MINIQNFSTVTILPTGPKITKTWDVKDKTFLKVDVTETCDMYVRKHLSCLFILNCLNDLMLNKTNIINLYRCNI